MPACTVTVTNKGSIDTDVVVLGLASRAAPDNFEWPIQQLFGFERVHVKGGDHATVTVHLAPQAITRVDSDGTESVVPGAYDLRLGGEPQGFATATLVVTGQPKVVSRLPKKPAGLDNK
eukprot:m.451738 g.451738  ORF g.451738 m.451738 type:complete len:119 (+) comp20325_c1_seq1:1082-1438(+)